MLSSISIKLGKSLTHTTAILGRPSSFALIPVQFSGFAAKNSNLNHKNWNFPRHKELLTDDYYDYEKSGKENPYGKQTIDKDY